MTAKQISIIFLSFFLIFILHPHTCKARKLGGDSPTFIAKNLGKIRPLKYLYKIDKIYQLGDSISDTGNLVLESPHGSGFLFTRLPYGVTTFGKPTGRCSNGLLMVDYFGMQKN